MFEFFTEEQKILRKVVHEFVEEKIAPFAAKWDEKGECPVEMFEIFGKQGFLGVFVSEEYGGPGLGLVERGIILEEVARYSAGLALALMTNDLSIAAIYNFGTNEQKKKHLPDLINGKVISGLALTEPTGGSDFMNQSTTIEKVECGYLLNGRKVFITNSHIAQLWVLCGKSGINEKGRNIINTIIIPPNTPGLSAGRKENKLGLRCSITGEVIANNVLVPEDCLLGGPGKGAGVSLHTISNFGRSGMAAIAVGILRGCMEESIKFSKDRILYGKPIYKLHSIQMIIGENIADYQAAHAMLYNALTIYDRKEDATSRNAAVKLFASEAAVRAAKRTIDLMGGYGIINEYAVGRFLRDALTIIPSAGTSHIMGIILATNAVS